MKQFLFLSGICVAAACGVHAAESAESLCATLSSGLTAQRDVLAGVQDSFTASAAVSALQDNFRFLNALHEHTDTNELWRYIENHPQEKQRLVSCLQQITIHLMRIEKADYYGCAPLRELLFPMLNPAADTPDAEPAA